MDECMDIETSFISLLGQFEEYKNTRNTQKYGRPFQPMQTPQEINESG